MSRVTNDEYNLLGDLARDNADDSERLTDWEREFLTGLLGRWTLYGNKTEISDKQSDVLKRIGDKYYQ